jgi:pSer/pThr/pTyr-binding forkhead associated (FHA) protein
MSQFIRICPKCQTQNPEYEHVCRECGQFIAMESPVSLPIKTAETETKTATPSEIPTEENKPSAPTQHFSTQTNIPAIYLELQTAEKPLFTVKSGWFIGQAYVENKAEIQINNEIEGSECVHRRHCRFVYKNQRWYVLALNQKRYQGEFSNPTKVNDKIIALDKARQIKHGDILRLSGLSFQIKMID